MKHLLLLSVAFVTSICCLAQSEAVLLKRADSLFLQKKWDAALQLYSKVLSKNPKSEKALIGRGKVYVYTEKYTEAEKDYTQALALNEKSSDAYVLKGLVAFNTNKIDEALSNYNYAIIFDKKNADAYIYRGIVFLHQEKVEQAMADINTVIELKPDYATAYYQKGIVLSWLSQPEKALQSILLAIQKDSTQAEFFKAAAYYYIQTADHPLSVKYYTKAIQLNNTDYELYINRGSSYMDLGNLDSCCRDFRSALALIPPGTTDTSVLAMKKPLEGNMSFFCDSSITYYYFRRGELSYDGKNYDKAIEWYTRGLARFPNNFLFMYHRALSWQGKKDYAKAEAEFNQCLILKNNLPKEVDSLLNFISSSAAEKQLYVTRLIGDLYRNRAECRRDLDDNIGAMADIEESLRILPNISDVYLTYYIKAGIYQRVEDYSSSIEWYNKAINLKPDFVEALANRAMSKIFLTGKNNASNKQEDIEVVLMRLRETGQQFDKSSLTSAMTDCNKAISLWPTYGYAYFVRGYIKLVMGEPDYCYDYLKAKQLGKNEADGPIKQLGCN